MSALGQERSFDPGRPKAALRRAALMHSAFNLAEAVAQSPLKLCEALQLEAIANQG
jgi:hypothetical protein